MRTLTKTIRETFVQDCCYRWELCGGLQVRILDFYFCDLGSVSGPGTEILQVTRCSQKSKDSCDRYERLNSSLNTIRAREQVGNLQPRSRVRGSVDGKLLRGNIKDKGDFG